MTADVQESVIRNAMTVDVEDYFQVQAFADAIPRRRWEEIPRRVEANVERILSQFEEAKTVATFFTLGWLAERHPGLIRRIVAGGHELASHGYAHLRADELSETEFRADIGRARKLLEDMGGVSVRGYRAPTFSIGSRNSWAFRAIEAEGYTYSSSVFPIEHDLYGMPNAPRFPFRPGSGALVEIPMTTIRFLGRNLPCAGGGYFRLTPYRLYRYAMRRYQSREARPGVFYFHPWEIDPEQPRVENCSRKARFRHYLNIGAMQARVNRLLRDFKWDRMDRVFAKELGQSGPPDSLAA